MSMTWIHHGNTQIKLKVLNVPSGVTFIWPGQDHDDAESNPTATKDLRETRRPWFRRGRQLNSLVATLEFVPAGLSTDTTERSTSSCRWIILADSLDLDGDVTTENAEDHGDRADTFELKLVVAIDAGQGGSRRHGRYLGLAPPGARF